MEHVLNSFNAVAQEDRKKLFFTVGEPEK